MSPSDSSSNSDVAPASDNNNEDAVESLGAALAGVSINHQSSSANFGSSVLSSPGAPFALAPGATMNENDGWGSFTPPAASTATSQSTKSLEEANANGTDNNHVRNESLELFLSQSPSQTLGEDVFKFSHTNLPALAEEERSHSEAADAFALSSVTPMGFGEIRPQQHETRRRNAESPSCSVTGTTTSSRSVSPYGNSNEPGGRIQAYRSYDNDSAQLTRNSNSNPNLAGLERHSPYNKDRNQIKAGSYDGMYDGMRLNQQQQQPQLQQPMDPNMSMPVGGVNGQVLYMAVPSPDGRGQVLQPVQMMQMPGKPYTYVVPQGATDQQSMMLLPTMQQGNGMDYNNRNGYNTLDSGENRDEYKPYQPDPAIASLYSAPQRPPLDALLGQVRRLSRDQVGCRLVQQALDEEGPMAATLILQEGLPFWGEAMVDPFGNYLFQKILEKVTLEERIMLVKNVSTRLVNASLNLHGTRSVQKIVEVCAQDEQQGNVNEEEESSASILTKALSPAAARLCIDSHGNHVIQRILLRLSAKHSQFIFDAVAASVGDVARHRHGCCVIQRCLDSPESEARSNLVKRIVEKSLELMQDAYGNYVVQYVLDVCSDDDVHAVCESVVGKVNLLAIQKFSSNVMEKCLERCTDHVKEMYMQEISDSERIRELMMDPFGNYVVQRALSVATHAQAIRLVESMRPHLTSAQAAGPNGQRNGGVRNTAGGRRIIAKICRRFPNFTLSPIGTQEELYSQNKGNHRYLNHHQQLPQGNHHHHPHGMQNGMQNGMREQPPLLAANGYAPVGMGQFDPRLAQMVSPPAMQQPQQYVMGGLAGNPAPLYYDPFAEAHGGYNSM